jgi:UDP-N-acetylmuramyl pentapeptide synthase
MSSGWTPVSTVANRTDTDRLRRTTGFGAGELAAVVGGRLLTDTVRLVRGAAVDSRRVARDQAFFALPGERTDGHRFLVESVAAGAAALIVTEPPAPSDRDLAARTCPSRSRTASRRSAPWRLMARSLHAADGRRHGSYAKTSTTRPLPPSWRLAW